jgi:hypothetical protein
LVEPERGRHSHAEKHLGQIQKAIQAPSRADEFPSGATARAVPEALSARWRQASAVFESRENERKSGGLLGAASSFGSPSRGFSHVSCAGGGAGLRKSLEFGHGDEDAAADAHGFDPA